MGKVWISYWHSNILHSLSLSSCHIPQVCIRGLVSSKFQALSGAQRLLAISTYILWPWVSSVLLPSCCHDDDDDDDDDCDGDYYYYGGKVEIGLRSRCNENLNEYQQGRNNPNSAEKVAIYSRSRTGKEALWWNGSLVTRGCMRNPSQVKGQRNDVFAMTLSKTLLITDLPGTLLIGHFRVPKTLTFKMRLSAQPFLWRWVLFT